MISGCFNLTGNYLPQALSNFTVEPVQGLKSQNIEAPGFSGIFYLNHHLPLEPHDFFFHDTGNDVLVLMSGYIYNRLELDGIGGAGSSQPDPVLAANMFLGEGPDFVKKLNGDFALFICRPGERRAFLFRDHVGIRPLAWVLDNDILFFSTDLMQLCRVLAADKGPDTTWLTSSFRFVDPGCTPFDKVKHVSPGHWLEFGSRRVKSAKYWDPAKIRVDTRMQYDTMISDLKRLIADAVAIRCDNRFNMAAHVSSGLDSALVAAEVRKKNGSGSPFMGYSWSPVKFNAENLPHDERDLVKSFCRFTGITPVFSGITPEKFHENTKRLFYNGGFFIEDDLVEQASADGFNLIFSGWGGDEFFSTGDRGIETDLIRSLRLRLYFQRNPVKPFKRFIKTLLEFTVFPALGILSPSVVRTLERNSMYLKKPFRKNKRKVLKNFYFFSSRRQMHLRYLKFNHLQERCGIWTVMGYRTGVEYRYPLLDKRIIEYMIKVPSELLCRNNQFRPLPGIVCRGLLPDDVLLNTTKKDHLFSAWWEELVKQSALLFMNEVEQWERNPDLSFIDFSRLKTDIRKYHEKQEGIENKILFSNIVKIGAVNSLTAEFRKRGKHGNK